MKWPTALRFRATTTVPEEGAEGIPTDLHRVIQVMDRHLARRPSDVLEDVLGRRGAEPTPPPGKDRFRWIGDRIVEAFRGPDATVGDPDVRREMRALLVAQATPDLDRLRPDILDGNLHDRMVARTTLLIDQYRSLVTPGEAQRDRIEAEVELHHRAASRISAAIRFENSPRIRFDDYDPAGPGARTWLRDQITGEAVHAMSGIATPARWSGPLAGSPPISPVPMDDPRTTKPFART